MKSSDSVMHSNSLNALPATRKADNLPAGRWTEVLWASLLLFVCAHFSVYYATDHPHLFSLKDYVDGVAKVPYQYRTLIAWLMRPDVSFQKAILLLGEGANGKSTYLAGVTAFLGHSNVSAVSLHKLESDRFAMARLVGKLANICPDLPSTNLAETSTFKALTGGDPVPAEYKYRDSFDFVPFARLVFSANYLPRSRDSSHAFFRRWYVVPFTRVFEGDDEIPRTEMDARLANPRELSGVLNKALQALKQIQESKGLMESVSMSAAANEFREITDPLAAWLNSSTIEKRDVFVTKKDLRSA